MGGGLGDIFGGIEDAVSDVGSWVDDAAQETLGNPIVGTVLKFTPLAPISYAYDFVNAANNDNPFGMIGSALGGYGALGGFSDGGFSLDNFGSSDYGLASMFNGGSSSLTPGTDGGFSFSGGELSNSYSPSLSNVTGDLGFGGYQVPDITSATESIGNFSNTVDPTLADYNYSNMMTRGSLNPATVSSGSLGAPPVETVSSTFESSTPPSPDSAFKFAHSSLSTTFQRLE